MKNREKPEGKKIIYLDNAATSWPKPPEVSAAVKNFMDNIGANPGRSGHHLSVAAARVVYSVRQSVADLFNAPDPLRVVFTTNVTQAINLGLLGFLHPGDHVITSSMEHNAVMRPLRFLETQGVELSVVQCSREGRLDCEDIHHFIRENTKLIIFNHASNVSGTILPIREIGKIAREHNIFFMTDEAQTGGAFTVDMESEYIDLLAFTGHKSLLGPTGTGGLIFGRRVDFRKFNPLIRGGTGSNSEKEEQPDFLPDRFESGTLNACGLAGLDAAIDWITRTGIYRIRSQEVILCQRLIDGLNSINGVKVYGSWDAHEQTATVSLTIQDLDNARVGSVLDEKYGILCRVGLHCSPAAHKTLGTYPQGTVRLSIGYFNTEEEVDQAIQAVHQIAKGR
jgi:cysteine desulfurase family protein